MRPDRLHKVVGFSFCFVTLAASSAVLADVGPRAVIKMPRDTPQAVSGALYAGAFEIHVFEAGDLADFKLEGEGWNVVSFDTPAAPGFTQVGTVRVPFRAVPRNADLPIRLSFRFDGRRVSKAYELGPRYFGRKVTAGRLRHLEGEETKLIAASPLTDADEGQVAAHGGAVPLQFSGRFVYTRPDGKVVGADHIWLEVMDDDGLATDALVDESIWSWHTDENGYFDSPIIWWDDCDAVGCDEPDIYIRFECDTGVGQVQDPGVTEEDYFWWTMGNIHEDFTGESIHFGTMTPNDAAEMPAVHIWNTLVRGHRYIGDVAGITVDHVDIQWPETGISTSQFSSDFDEIYITADDSWSDGTVMHEYGHHFIWEHAAYTSSDYCNDFCDGESVCTSGTDCEDEGHCLWCPENDHDAWNEGFPNWLGYVIPTSFSDRYEFDDCTPYMPIGPYGFEFVDKCCQDTQWHDPWITEGFTAALLRDISDQKDDRHDPEDDDDAAWSDTTDCLALGPEEIFTVTAVDQPTTPAEFISMFRSRYPQLTPGLWKTARNVHPNYADEFPADTDPPGPVTVLDSPTHPIGVGGALPCITVEFDQPLDDVTGSRGFSVDFTTNPGGVVPSESVNEPGYCVSQATSSARDFGTYYVSIRAVDDEDHWGPHETFGPFVINGDCNSNGIIDLCDVACDASGYAESAGQACVGATALCAAVACDTSEDCNLNLVPDECDLASGTSKDCDRDGIPDECAAEADWLIQWADGNGSWHHANNWYKYSECPEPPPPPTCDYTFPTECPAVPELADNVCINSVYEDITVTYTTGVTDIDILACYENLAISGNASATLKLFEPSWVDGELGLSGSNSVLEVNDSLDIGGLFAWTGSGRLTGPGETYAHGGVQTSDIVYLDEHHLILDNNSTSVGTGRVEFVGASVFEIWPGSSYEHQGGRYFLNGYFDDLFVNGGTLIKSVDPGDSVIYMYTNNSGLIHVKAGTLKFYLGGSHTGEFRADPGTTLDFTGARQEFLPSSSIVAETVKFSSGVSGSNSISGTYNVSGSSSFTGGDRTDFTSVANVVNYGPDLTINPADVRLDAAFGGPINFDSVYVRGVLYFNSGDPINITTLTNGGTIRGPSEITVSGLLTWNGGGHFRGPGVVNANGDVVIGPGGSEKTLYERVFNNAGTATFLGGLTLGTSVVFNNLATGVMDIQADSGSSGSIISGLRQNLDNAGTLVKSAGDGISTISAPTTNTGTVEVQTGVLRFYTHYNGYYVQTAGQTVLNGGDIFMFGPASMQFQGGLLTGEGTITGNVVNTGATAAPGLSAGVIDIDGNYTQTTGATLEIEIDGLIQTTEHDLLTVSGTASLAGILEVMFPTSGFTPSSGDRFQVVRGGSVTGEFEQVNVTNLPPDKQMIVYYSPTTVTLIIPPVDGDCDGNYVVGLGDLPDFATCLAGPQGGLGQDCDCADIDGDSDVDLGDVALFQIDFTGPLP